MTTDATSEREELARVVAIADLGGKHAPQLIEDHRFRHYETIADAILAAGYHRDAGWVATRRYEAEFYECHLGYYSRVAITAYNLDDARAAARAMRDPGGLYSGGAWSLLDVRAAPPTADASAERRGEG